MQSGAPPPFPSCRSLATAMPVSATRLQSGQQSSSAVSMHAPNHGSNTAVADGEEARSLSLMHFLRSSSFTPPTPYTEQGRTHLPEGMRAQASCTPPPPPSREAGAGRTNREFAPAEEGGPYSNSFHQAEATTWMHELGGEGDCHDSTAIPQVGASELANDSTEPARDGFVGITRGRLLRDGLASIHALFRDISDISDISSKEPGQTRGALA